jgi:hypothetical protein
LYHDPYCTFRALKGYMNMYIHTTYIFSLYVCTEADIANVAVLTAVTEEYCHRSHDVV